MKKIAITGLSGAIGQIVAKTVPSEYLLIDLFHKQKYLGSARSGKIIHKHIDIASKDSVERTLDSVQPDAIIHMAAITHIDSCENDMIHGKDGITWKTNVDGANHIARFSAKNNIPVFYLSTECVFDGKQDSYNEMDKKNPKNWYGRTKHEAEEILLSSGPKITVIRAVIAYHDNDNGKTIFGRILSLLRMYTDIIAVGDQRCSYTYTFDIAQAIWNAVENNLCGVFHVTPEASYSPYDFVLQVAKSFHFDLEFVTRTTLNSYFGKKRAELRLKNASLSQQYSNRMLSIHPRKPSEAFANMSV